MALPDYVLKHMQEQGGTVPQGLPDYVLAAMNQAPAPVAPPESHYPESASPQENFRQAIGATADYITQPLPTRSPLEMKYWTENVPQSLNRAIPAMVVGTGQMAYNAAKKFTDPIANAWSGQQDLGSAAKDLFYAPRDAGAEIFNGLAHATAAPTGILGAEEAKKAWSDPAAAAGAIAPLGIGAWKGGKAMIPGPTEAGLVNQLGRTVATGFDKGVRPTGAPKTRNMLLEEQRLQQEAVKSIVDSKEFLQFKDKFGDPVIGQLPKNLDEFSQAIAQRKTAVITKANEMNKAAGEAGIIVDLNPVIGKLEEIINNKVLQDNAPGAVSYAKQKLDSYAERGQYTPEEAQEAMAILNRSVEVAKKTPTLDTISTAQVDALIANNMRQLLNDAVEGATGPGYADLRREFGALKSIEAPVNKKLKQDKQRSEASALNFYDVFSASDLLGGILGGNVVSAGKGIGLGLMAQKLRLAKDPNRAVAKMFEKSEKIVGQLKELMPEKEAAKVVATIEPNMPKENALASPEPSFAPPEVNSFERMFQIAQSPQGKQLLLERLGREQKNAEIAQMIMEIPDAVPPMNYPLVPVQNTKIYHIPKTNPLGQL